ncbi:MAG: ATP-binding cassette domain-containing protein, partial [Cyclobacteriaceae bacterium]
MIKLSLHKVLQDTEGDMPLSIDLSIEEGSFVSFFGPSGSGKTSILRMFAGLLAPDSGLIEVEGNTWYNSETKQYLKVKNRRVGYLFQDYALFPNMTVLQNLQFALKKGQEESQVQDIVRLTGLG